MVGVRRSALNKRILRQVRSSVMFMLSIDNLIVCPVLFTEVLQVLTGSCRRCWTAAVGSGVGCYEGEGGSPCNATFILQLKSNSALTVVLWRHGVSLYILGCACRWGCEAAVQTFMAVSSDGHCVKRTKGYSTGTRQHRGKKDCGKRSLNEGPNSERKRNPH